MRYQYKREPLTGDEATRLANACNSHEEKLVAWTLLDTGLQVVSQFGTLLKAEPERDSGPSPSLVSDGWSNGG